MRPALLLAAALVGAALAPVAARADEPDKTLLDIRCVVVGGALAQSDDQSLQNLGRASLFYFLGRIEGRGATDNLASRVVEMASKMSADDIKTEAKTCGAMFMAATQSLQTISDTFRQRLGAPSSAPPAP